MVEDSMNLAGLQIDKETDLRGQISIPDVIGVGERGEITPGIIRRSLRQMKKNEMIRVTKDGRQINTHITESGVIVLNLPRANSVDKLHEMIHVQQMVQALDEGIPPVLSEI